MWTIAFEERDLIAQYGARYRAYREQVGMLLPRRPRKVEQETPLEEVRGGDGPGGGGILTALPPHPSLS